MTEVAEHEANLVLEQALWISRASNSRDVVIRRNAGVVQKFVRYDMRKDAAPFVLDKPNPELITI